MYKAVLFAPDGEWVTDYRSKTIGQVVDKLVDRGSRWIFYPFDFVIVDHGYFTNETQRIVDAWEPLDWMKGKTIASVSKWLKANPDLVGLTLALFCARYRTVCVRYRIVD